MVETEARPVFFNDTATTEIYTLSLHDALPISEGAPFYLMMYTAARVFSGASPGKPLKDLVPRISPTPLLLRSEEHTSELQSRQYLVCRLLLEKKRSQPDARVAASAAVRRA